MTTVTLTEFLLARIAEDEAAARGLNADLAREFGTCETQLYSTLDSVGTGYSEMPALSIDSTRVLAECEAKRRIVEAVSGWQHETVEDCWYSCAATYGTEVEDACCNDGAGTECDCGLDYRKAQILEPLALPYADHPDYREKWRPDTPTP
jgi:hypothetical protein